MTLPPSSPLPTNPFSRDTVPSLRGLRSEGVPAPIPVLGPSEGSNTTFDDPQTLRTPIPIIPSSFFVGVPDALGGESHPQSAVDANAVTKHIESHKPEFQLHFPAKPFRSQRPPPPPPVLTPSRPPVTEKSYHTVTFPCTREANSTEIATILQAPSRLLGHKFMPSHGQEIWEAVEVSVGTIRTNPDGTTADDGHRPAVPLRLQNPETMEKIQEHSKAPQWTKEPEVTDAFADHDDEDKKPVPQLVGTGEVVVKFRGYEGQVGEHYMLVRDFVEMLKDRAVLIVELE